MLNKTHVLQDSVTEMDTDESPWNTLVNCVIACDSIPDLMDLARYLGVLKEYKVINIYHIIVSILTIKEKILMSVFLSFY